MALRPPIQQSVAPLIRRLSAQYRIDPRAAIAVALGEGGLRNRIGDVGDLAGGGSYGPFQLYAKGALPRNLVGRPQAADQWAWSPEGIRYALSRMAEAGASGLTGRSAVDTIIRKFERPADPNKSVRNALARYGTIGGGGSSVPESGRLALPGSSSPAPAVPNDTRKTAMRNHLLQGLASGGDIYDLIGSMPALEAPQRPLTALPQASATPTPFKGNAAVEALGTPRGKGDDLMRWVGKPERRSGPSAPHKPETLRFVAQVGKIAGKRLTPWGNESHSLTTVNGRPSQHGTGDAADIPASGAELIRIGQAALIAAGANPAWARKQKGGLFNVNGRQIIFATNQGGNHFDHVHVGL